MYFVSVLASAALGAAEVDTDTLDGRADNTFSNFIAAAMLPIENHDINTKQVLP